MSENLTAYIVSVAILAALALFIPCIELLARLLRTASRKEEAQAAESSPCVNTHEVA